MISFEEITLTGVGVLVLDDESEKNGSGHTYTLFFSYEMNIPRETTMGATSDAASLVRRG